MKLHKHKKLTTIMALMLCLVIVAAGTFAWLTSRSSRLNHFETASSFTGELSVSEIFTPPTEWKPGETVNKDVVIINTGDITLNVRVGFEEILRKLANDGEKTYATEMPDYIGGTYAEGPLAYTDKIPALTNIADFIPDNGWEVYTGDIEYEVGLVGTLPNEAVVLLKREGDNVGAKVYVPVTFNGKDVYQAVEIGNDFGMETDASDNITEITIKGIENTDSSSPNFGDFEIKFPYFEGYDEFYADWAGTEEFVDDASAPRKPADIDKALTDADEFIDLLYASGNLSVTPVAGKWFYNDADGYFYYCSPLAPAASTPKLLEGVSLDGAADQAHANMKFDLGVVALGIQNSVEALTATSSGGWGLTDTALIELLLG